MSNALNKLQRLSDARQVAEQYHNDLKYSNRDMHPNAIDSVTPALKVNNAYQSLRQKLCVLSHLELSNDEIALYTDIPKYVIDAIIPPADSALLTADSEEPSHL